MMVSEQWLWFESHRFDQVLALVAADGVTIVSFEQDLVIQPRARNTLLLLWEQ